MFGQFWIGNHLAWSPVFVPVEMAIGDGHDAQVSGGARLEGEDEVVVVRTGAVGVGECFVLQRRKCYWAILDGRARRREVA